VNGSHEAEEEERGGSEEGSLDGSHQTAPAESSENDGEEEPRDIIRDLYGASDDE